MDATVGNPIEAAPPSNNLTLKRRVRLVLALLFLLVLMGINLAIGSGKITLEKVISESMEPTLLVGDEILVDTNGYLDRYAVVCLKNPENLEEKLVKRIIGLPGDRVTLQDGILYLNGKEEYSTRVATNKIFRRLSLRVEVPSDCVFVMGDNRNNSYDSVDFGPVPCETVLGVVNCIIWPKGRWGKIPPFKDSTD